MITRRFWLNWDFGWDLGEPNWKAGQYFYLLFCQCSDNGLFHALICTTCAQHAIRNEQVTWELWCRNRSFILGDWLLFTTDVRDVFTHSNYLAAVWFDHHIKMRFAKIYLFLIHEALHIFGHPYSLVLLQLRTPPGLACSADSWKGSGCQKYIFGPALGVSLVKVLSSSPGAQIHIRDLDHQWRYSVHSNVLWNKYLTMDCKHSYIQALAKLASPLSM